MSKTVQKNKQFTKNRIQNVGPASQGAQTPPQEEQNKAQEKKGEAQNDFAPGYTVIQVRAYEIYQQRGGFHLDNWFEAERILKEELQRAADQNKTASKSTKKNS